MDRLTLNNVCGGAAHEIFERYVSEILRNIKDPNTDPEAVRKVTLEFKFKPHTDRSGAEVTISPKASTCSVKPVKGTMFISTAEGSLAAYPKDVRQDALFGETKAAKI